MMKKIAWGFTVLATVFTLIGAWLLISAGASSQWPTVSGTITEAKVVGRINQVSDTLRRYVDYAVEIEYSYLVEGQFYLSDRFSLGSGSTVEDGFSEKSEARTWLKESPYQVKNNVVVYVDPSDPHSTVLDAGIQGSTWIPLIMALCCGILAWMCFMLDAKILLQQKSSTDYQ